MVKPFADAVAALEKGKYTTEPVQSEFGFHVILLEDTRSPEVPEFEQVKPQVEMFAQRKKLQALSTGFAKRPTIRSRKSCQADFVGRTAGSPMGAGRFLCGSHGSREPGCCWAACVAPTPHGPAREAGARLVAGHGPGRRTMLATGSGYSLKDRAIDLRHVRGIVSYVHVFYRLLEGAMKL